MNRELFNELLEQYLTGNLTGGEKKQFIRTLDLQEYRDHLDHFLEETWMTNRYEGSEDPEETKKFVEQLKEKLKEHPSTELIPEEFTPRPKVFHLVRKIAAAAAVLLLLISGYWLLGDRRGNKQQVTGNQPHYKNDVSPGGNKAVLTLANGAAIILDSAHTGMLARQGSSQVMKMNSGLLAYKPLNAHHVPLTYNTLTTPRGGQYQLMLPDGSKVWLNAASSIRFPTAFTGKQREVEITGEVYFEITQNATMPFIVKKGNVEIRVLGTHFNVNAYEDEPALKITLLEGSVKVVASDGQWAMLKPREQAILRQAQDDYKITVNKNADVSEVVAWKNGYFEFNNEAIEDIMRQVARWYNVDVHYRGNISQLFIGKVPRNVNVSIMFKILEATGWVHFEIDGRRITVEP